MMTEQENEILTRTGPGTPTGEWMRRFWVPAALSRELPEPDCPPIRVKLLGEKLVAFRDTQGRVGLVDEFCAHRRASLFLGRNEEGGLRCIYHGWKYDVAGNCLEQPNEPTQRNFAQKIHLKAYSTLELGGLIWAYMGPNGKMPAPPKFNWTQVPDTHRHVSKVWQECNWLQAMEGGFDHAHALFLHRNLTANSTKPGLNPTNKMRMWSPTKPKIPSHNVESTHSGLVAVTTFALDAGKKEVTTVYYIMPFHQARAATTGGEVKESIVEGHIWVPIDDENCIDYVYRYSQSDEKIADVELLENRRARGPGDLTADFRKVRNKDVNWMIDRHVQKTETFSGLDGIDTQDHAVQESMGPIVDRSREHLGSSDEVITALRRLLLDTVRMTQNGYDPPEVNPRYDEIRPSITITE